jgi:RNA polymerase sigma-70 factor (ECF subfamily)
LREIQTPLRLKIRGKVPPSDEEDTLQEILLSVHKARHSFSIERPLAPWLFAVANFRIQDCQRKFYAMRRDKMSDVDDYKEILPNVTETTSDHELLEEALASVSDREKRLLTLIHTEGRSMKETAQIVNMSVSAVKTAVFRAVQKIKERL